MNLTERECDCFDQEQRNQKTGGSQMKKVSVATATAVVAMVVLLGISIFGKPQSTSPSDPQAPVQYKPSAAVKMKATSPAPGPAAKQKSTQATIGKGKAMVDTGHSNNSFWVESIDLEGKGKATETQMLWDDTDKVMYLYADKTFKCSNGASADSGLLIATYAAGNMRKEPVGSGWWASALNENQCGVKSEALYGCKFNPSGTNTTCGLADLDEKTNELVIIEATER
jgi:hypothetical protein